MDPLHVQVPGGAPYDIVIEEGALATLADRVIGLLDAHRYAVISDSQVARLLGARVLADFDAAGVQAELFEFPAGEWNKSRDQWSDLSDRMLDSGVGRDAAVVALGGGVTGDLAGFVAATYMRGLPIVQIPTTLLAMLDSSVGGKTGVDTEAGKNLIGAFHHPALVVIDPLVLDTLPRMQRLAGLAEGIKTAAILDEGLWQWIEENAERLVAGEVRPLTELVRRTVEHKASVVAADPREGGLRAILNFGHTVGHAIETLEGYTVLHGEAVAAGMRVEARLGEILGVTTPGTAARITGLLEACRLDREWEEERRHDEIAAAMELDKKSRAARPRCVFLETIGTVARDPEGRYTTALDGAALEAPLADALRPAVEP